jgi:hypothetical protein
MKLIKITDKSRSGGMHLIDGEILFCSWNIGETPKFYAFKKSKTLRAVDEVYFTKKIVGDNYAVIQKILPQKIYSYSITKGNNGDIYFCEEIESVVYKFDNMGNLVFKWEVELGQGHPVYDIKFQPPDFLWLAFPTGQTVAQVNISTKQEVFKIGTYTWDDIYEPLNYPESIFIKDGYLYIPNMGDGKLFKVDVLTKDIELIAVFEERVWQYVESEIGVFLLTSTGIYEISNEQNDYKKTTVYNICKDILQRVYKNILNISQKK